MTEEQIKHMVNQFLNWKLPENFNPDDGISFKRTFNEHTDHPMKHEPFGTNLLDSVQAEAMVRHMIEGLPVDTSNIKALLLRSPEYGRLCGIAAAASALAAVYPARCTAPAKANHPQDCHCGQIVLDRALQATE